MEQREMVRANSNLMHAELTDRIIGTFYEVYNELGHGFLESVYENSLSIALRQQGLEVLQQIAVPVTFRGALVGDFTADMMVEKSVILELKAVRAIDPAHEVQLLNYLKATEIEVGLLLNFGVKPTFKRLAFSNTRKAPTTDPNASIFEALFPKSDLDLSASSAKIRG